jgi:hypothetical protein
MIPVECDGVLMFWVRRSYCQPLEYMSQLGFVSTTVRWISNRFLNRCFFQKELLIMKRSLFAVAASMMVFAGVAQAQRPVTVGVAAGVSLPVGKLGDAANTGFNVAASATLKPVMVPFGVRLEAGYDQFGLEGVDGNLRSFNVTGNAIVTVPSATPLKPYLIGGLGWYNVKTEGFDAVNKLGLNVGAGINMPLSGFDTFLEARYHVLTNTSPSSFRFIPITFGVRF